MKIVIFGATGMVGSGATKESAPKPILENHEINEWMAGA